MLTNDFILKKLSGGKTPEIGEAEALIPEIIKSSKNTTSILRFLLSDNPLISFRVANILKKASVKAPENISANKLTLLEICEKADLKTGIPIDFPLLLAIPNWDSSELESIFEWLLECFDNANQHTFTKVNCLDSLAKLSLRCSFEKEAVKEVIATEAENNPKASIRARCRKLLKLFH
ncbi:hypothetical protein FUAX_16400 [Fulvitalea axinellae]|uniref:HEAT repeat domain-containing protein n=1 Tax=Fulvitalea axinellae TaxID=1182444 RepID=A0AAU9CGR2_9BACT|nr:hypothetical protein FUAX_16400 [Fulvitalea axinellae]